MTTPTSNVLVRSRLRNSIFQGSTVKFLAGAASPKSIPKSHGLPEVIVTGRANVGKSSLLNAVLRRNDFFHTSQKAGRTRQLNFSRVGPEPGRLVIVDAPGYGAKGKDEWGEIFDHYLRRRAELRRVFILLNAKNGLNDYDFAMLEHLSGFANRTFQIQPVLTKLNAVPVAKLQDVIALMRRDIEEYGPGMLSPILTSVQMTPKVGVEEMQDAILEACGLLK